MKAPVITEHEESYIKIPFAENNLSQLETRMNGGLIGGRFYLLGGIPSASKTMLVNNLADNICVNGQAVLVFSYDDGKTELRYRTFARFSSHTIEDFNQKKLNKEGLNFAGLRALLAMIPCWKIKSCTLKDRNKCEAYHSVSNHCWEESEKGRECKNTECKFSEVYLYYYESQNLKAFLKN